MPNPRLPHPLASTILAMVAAVCTTAAAAQDPGAATVRDSSSGSHIARGVVRAVAEATLTARLSARITEMPFAEGESFAKGANLVTLDCERPKAEARAADAVVAAQRKQLETNQELDRFNAIGKNDLQISMAQLDKAQADAEALASQLKSCALEAPFTGRVVSRLARQHEAVQAGTPILKIVDTSGTEIDLIVPSQWLAWLAPGTRFNFSVDETGRVWPAKVLRLSPNVDPVSRTVRIVATFTAPSVKVLPGMSGTATAWSRRP